MNNQSKTQWAIMFTFKNVVAIGARLAAFAVRPTYDWLFI